MAAITKLINVATVSACNVFYTARAVAPSLFVRMSTTWHMHSSWSRQYVLSCRWNQNNRLTFSVQIWINNFEHSLPSFITSTNPSVPITKKTETVLRLIALPQPCSALVTKVFTTNPTYSLGLFRHFQPAVSDTCAKRRGH